MLFEKDATYYAEQIKKQEKLLLPSLSNAH